MIINVLKNDDGSRTITCSEDSFDMSLFLSKHALDMEKEKLEKILRDVDLSIDQENILIEITDWIEDIENRFYKLDQWLEELTPEQYEFVKTLNPQETV